MPSRSDLELRITEKLRTLPAVALQWLAEDIALIRDPKRYKNLFGKGRNAEAQTTKGWPDAYVVRSDGTVDGVEATRDRCTWTQHLTEDIEKAKSPDHPNLNGYLFVAGYPDYSPTHKELGLRVRRFCELGIPEDRVDLLVGTGLVLELLQPKYARTLQWILGLSPRPEYFELIRQEQVPGKIESAFEPEAAEYRHAFVHRPALADTVESRLSEDGCALIRGWGAAGKSVLARLIAAGSDYRVLPAYKLDLKPFVGRVEDLRGKIDNILVEFGGEGVLFILDNIHLEEEFAVGVFHGWRELARWHGTRLLLVGRETRRIAGSAFEEAPIIPLVLRARADDVRGVYRRLARRELSTEHEPPEPPKDILRTWVKSFGGDPKDSNHSVDLMAFSAAARNQMTRLLRCDWELNVSHARNEVRKRYLAPLLDDERKNLLRLAAISEDVALPLEALAYPYDPFDKCIKEGLVFETEHGEDKYIRYSLAHSALGKLLLAAAEPQVDRAAECRKVAHLSPFTGLYLAKHLAGDAEEDLARTTLQAIAENPNWLKIFSSVQHLPHNLRMARRLGIDILPVGKPVPSAMREHIFEAALGTPLDHLVTFLRFARSTESGLSDFHKALVADLVQHPAATVKRAREKTELHVLVTFLTYARSEARGLSRLHADLVADLVQHPAATVKRAREKTELDALVTFLTYARSEASGLSKLHAELVADLVQHPLDLAKRARETALDALVTFLTYVRSEESGFPAIDSEFAQNVLNSVDIEAWNRKRGREKPQQPDFMVNVANLFSQMGRPELVATPARVLIEAADPGAWHVPVIGINHLSHTIRFSAGVKRHHLVRFLDRIVTPTWLDRNYSQAAQGGLAGPLLALATNLPPEFHSRFVTPSLQTRLNRDLAAAESGDIDAWAKTFSLIGSAAVLGATAICRGVRWPDGQALARIVESRRPPDNAFGVLQIQFWCGLREMARRRSDSVKVPPGEAKIVLASWRNAQPPTPFATACNASMIAWLERCETAEWILDRSGPAIREDIINQLSAE